ncbi:MAG: response regulator transcription factor [Betaproteobacteria bacterium]
MSDFLSPTKILLLEDHGMVRSGMKALIQIAEPAARIYEASSFEEAVATLLETEVDIAFLDFDLKAQKTGLDVLRYIREAELDTRAIMLSAHKNKELVIECIDAGACGYIPKAIDDDGVFRRALDTVFHGGVFLPASVLGRGGQSPEPPISSPRVPAESLGITGRLLEVLYYLCQGLQNKTIADRMGISEGTVRKDYVSKLLRIFKVARRTQLVIEVSRRDITIPKPNPNSLVP